MPEEKNAGGLFFLFFFLFLGLRISSWLTNSLPWIQAAGVGSIRNYLQRPFTITDRDRDTP